MISKCQFSSHTRGLTVSVLSLKDSSFPTTRHSSTPSHPTDLIQSVSRHEKPQIKVPKRMSGLFIVLSTTWL